MPAPSTSGHSRQLSWLTIARVRPSNKERQFRGGGFLTVTISGSARLKPSFSTSEIASVPESGAVLLMLFGLIGNGAICRRQQWRDDQRWRNGRR